MSENRGNGVPAVYRARSIGPNQIIRVLDHVSSQGCPRTATDVASPGACIRCLSTRTARAPYHGLQRS